MTPKEELIKAIEQSPDWLIQDLLNSIKQSKLETNQPSQTVLERMGGIPKYLLSDGNLSDRDRRRTIITSHLQHRYRKD
jgi:hypothetical protein